MILIVLMVSQNILTGILTYPFLVLLVSSGCIYWVLLVFLQK